MSFNNDSTFLFQWRFDMSGRWTEGRWSYTRDTIYLLKIAVLDTLVVNGQNGSVYGSLILSSDNKKERYTEQQFLANGLSTSQQNLRYFPDTLFMKRSKLFEIHNGRRVIKRVRGIMTDKRWKKSYFKVAARD